jgi:hypothetical protein
MTVVQLPTFEGYTVDLRLKQFRKAIPGKTLEFVSFDSPEGKRMVARYAYDLGQRYAKAQSALEMEENLKEMRALDEATR